MYLDCDVDDIFEFVDFNEDMERNPYYDSFVIVGKNDYVMYVYEENFNDVKEYDIIEGYEMVEEKK